MKIHHHIIIFVIKCILNKSLIVFIAIINNKQRIIEVYIRSCHVASVRLITKYVSIAEMSWRNLKERNQLSNTLSINVTNIWLVKLIKIYSIYNCSSMKINELCQIKMKKTLLSINWLILINLIPVSFL